MREDPERRYPLSFLREHSSFRRQTGRYGYEAQCEKSAGGGSVAGITEGQINGLVRLRLLDGHLITANISMKAIEWDAAEGGQAGLRRDQGYRGDGRRRAGENQCAESAARKNCRSSGGYG